MGGEVLVRAAPLRRVGVGWESHRRWAEGIMTNKSIYGLKPSQLGRLLSVSACVPESVSDVSDDEIKAVMLRDLLGRRPADEPDLQEALRSISAQATGRAPHTLGRSLRELLLDPQSDTTILQAIKDHTKRLSATVTSGSQTLMTTTIYYAAIAAALVHHGERITKYSWENLAERFSLLAQRTWIDDDIKGLFARAAEGCRQRGKGIGGQ